MCWTPTGVSLALTPSRSAQRLYFKKISIMRKFIEFGVVFISLFCLGCMGHAEPHTHIWYGNHEKNVWTYKPVEKIEHRNGNTAEIKDHFEYQIKDGEIITLKDGIKIKAIDRSIYIGSEQIPDDILNLFITNEGKIEYDTFIRIFE